MKNLIETVGEDRIALLMSNRIDGLLDSKSLKPNIKIEMLECLLLDYKMLVQILLDNKK